MLESETIRYRNSNWKTRKSRKKMNKYVGSSRDGIWYSRMRTYGDPWEHPESLRGTIRIWLQKIWTRISSDKADKILGVHALMMSAKCSSCRTPSLHIRPHNLPEYTSYLHLLLPHTFLHRHHIIHMFMSKGALSEPLSADVIYGYSRRRRRGIEGKLRAVGILFSLSNLTDYWYGDYLTLETFFQSSDLGTLTSSDDPFRFLYTESSSSAAAWILKWIRETWVVQIMWQL